MLVKVGKGLWGLGRGLLPKIGIANQKKKNTVKKRKVVNKKKKITNKNIVQNMNGCKHHCYQVVNK